MVGPQGRPWYPQTLADQGQLWNKVLKPWQLEQQKHIFLLSEAWKTRKVLAGLASLLFLLFVVLWVEPGSGHGNHEIYTPNPGLTFQRPPSLTLR